MPYKIAHFHIGSHVKEDAPGKALVFHETRHVVYEQFLTPWVEHVMKRYVPESDRTHIQKLFDDSIESLIENDTFWVEQACAF